MTVRKIMKNFLDNKYVRKIVDFVKGSITVVFFIVLFVTFYSPFRTIMKLIFVPEYGVALSPLLSQAYVEFMLGLLCVLSLFLGKYGMRICWIIFLLDIPAVFNQFPGMREVWDYELCFDEGYCKASVRESVSREDCLAHNGMWNIDEEMCDYGCNRDTCEIRFGGDNWELPEICKQKKPS